MKAIRIAAPMSPRSSSSHLRQPLGRLRSIGVRGRHRVAETSLDLAGTLQLTAREPPLRDLVHDHDREDQDALEDDHELAGNLGLDLERRLAAGQDPPQDRREDDADRVVLPEERDRDPGEAELRLIVLDERAALDQDLL